MTQSNNDIQMAPRQAPMPHEGPPTTRDMKSLTMYVALALVLITGFVVAGLILA